jgi:hypothetical protein
MFSGQLQNKIFEHTKQNKIQNKIQKKIFEHIELSKTCSPVQWSAMELVITERVAVFVLNQVFNDV